LPIAAAGSDQAVAAAGSLCLLVSACFLAAWLLRLGWIADYFSKPVLIGYIHGVAVVLVISQLGKLLGLSVEAGDPLPELREVLTELTEANGQTVLVSVIALSVLLAARVWALRLPAALIVVVAGIAVSWAFDLQAEGVATVGNVGRPACSRPARVWR
jgi:MFS superfamily sulfate permease-like transporter